MRTVAFATVTSRSMTVAARLTTNMLEWSESGIRCPRRTASGVKAFRRQQTPHADARRHRQDHRQDDAVIARHLEKHGDRRQHGAGAAPDHRRHSDHREGGNVQRHRQVSHVQHGGESASERRPHIQRRREDAARRAGAEGEASWG